MTKDKCVMCNKETQYNQTDNINNRNHYVEGAGQLCKPCWSDIYRVRELA